MCVYLCMCDSKHILDLSKFNVRMYRLYPDNDRPLANERLKIKNIFTKLKKKSIWRLRYSHAQNETDIV